MSLQEIEPGLKIWHMRENMTKEEKAVEAINESLKYFYRYAKSIAQIKVSIGPVKNMNGGENLVKDNPETCEML